MAGGKRGKNGRGRKRSRRRGVKLSKDVDTRPEGAPVGLQWHDRVGRDARRVPSFDALKNMRAQEARVESWLSTLKPGQMVVVSTRECVPVAIGGAADGGIWCSFSGQEESLRRKLLARWPDPEFEGGCAEPRVVVVDNEMRRIGLGSPRDLVVSEDETGDVLVVILAGVAAPLSGDEAVVMGEDARHHMAPKEMKRFVCCLICCCLVLARPGTECLQARPSGLCIAGVV